MELPGGLEFICLIVIWYEPVGYQELMIDEALVICLILIRYESVETQG